jgi:hypothetical protein
MDVVTTGGGGKNPAPRFFRSNIENKIQITVQGQTIIGTDSSYHQNLLRLNKLLLKGNTIEFINRTINNSIMQHLSKS